MLLAYGFIAAYVTIAAALSPLVFWCVRLLRRNVRVTVWMQLVWRGLSVLFTIYVVVLVGGFGYQLIFSGVTASTNDAQREPGRSVPDELLARLHPPGTLVLVSLSGGGSRAAYFAAAILEGLQSFHVGEASAIDGSLVYNIDLLSTASGGSLAGAYFAARLPDPARTDAARLAIFFRDFKQAMAENFEAHILRQLADPRYTLAYLTLQRSVASGLADVFDSTLLGNRRFTFAELNRNAVQERRPLFVPNATNLNNLHLLPFAGSGSSIFSGDILPSGRPDPRDNRIIPWASDLPNESIGFSTFSLYHTLDNFPVAEAVAASAAFPSLGFIPVFMPRVHPHSVLHLADGGIVDNSGLLSLYALAFQRSLFERASGSLRRIVLISIDATANPASEEDNPTVADEITGIYALQQRYAELFVAPSWLHRLFGEELSGLFPNDAPLPVSFPPRIVFSYNSCRRSADPTVPTSLHLSRGERGALDRAAQTCIDMNRDRLEASLNQPYTPYPRYEGTLKKEDYAAAHALFRLADQQRLFENDRHHWALDEEFRQAAEVWWRPPPSASGYMSLGSPMTIELASELTPEKTGFVFDAKADGDALVLRATPQQYGKTGFVSLMIKVTREMAHMKDGDFCMETNKAIRGGDYAGRPAPDTAGPFHPPRRKPSDYPCI
jgi:predicted acylesterase/phospholipase RssA